MTAVFLTVVGAGRSVGTSVTSAVMADLLATFGVRCCLLNVAPPYATPDLAATSGLADAALSETSVPGVSFRVGRRASGAPVLGLGSPDRSRASRPGFWDRFETPVPKEWLAQLDDLDLVIVDLGFDVLDGIGVADDPVTAWLREPPGAVYPVVVTLPSRPGMQRLHDVLDATHATREAQHDVSAANGVANDFIVVSRARAGTEQLVRDDLLQQAGPRAMALADEKLLEFMPESPAVVTDGIPHEFDAPMFDIARAILYGCGAVKE